MNEIQALTDPAYTGLGDNNAKLKVYIGNRPPFTLNQATTGVCPLHNGDIYAIGQACGNGWRKVFNLYAKLAYALGRETMGANMPFSCWQALRDDALLQPTSRTALLFQAPDFSDTSSLHVVMGKTYANSLDLPASLAWLTPQFALDAKHNLVVCPYFDYRQLSNAKLIYLVDLIRSKLTVY